MFIFKNRMYDSRIIVTISSNLIYGLNIAIYISMISQEPKCTMLAWYPGIPMFFNVHEKNREGLGTRLCYAMNTRSVYSYFKSNITQSCPMYKHIWWYSPWYMVLYSCETYLQLHHSIDRVISIWNILVQLIDDRTTSLEWSKCFYVICATPLVS